MCQPFHMQPLFSCLLLLLLLVPTDQDLGPIPLGRPAIATFTLPAGPHHLDRLEASCACQKIELLPPNQAPQTLPHRGKLQTNLPAGITPKDWEKIEEQMNKFKKEEKR